MSDTTVDLCILGAGAAGLVAAGAAAAAGVDTLLLEKGRQTGIKILIAGGGHCNLTHECSVNRMLDGYGAARAWLTPSMKRFSPKAVRRYFDRIGVPTYVGEWEKVWPVSRSAKDVRNALERDAVAAGAAIRTDTPARGVERTRRGFAIATPDGEVHCTRLLITTGGRSYPKTGTTGDGYGFARELGHSIVEPVPALVPLVVDAPWVRELSGVSLAAVRTRLVDGDDAVHIESHGPLLLTHKGLSGPAALDLGGAAARLAKRFIEIDWLPTVPVEDVRARLRDAHALGRTRVSRVVADWLPERLGTALVRDAAIPDERRAAELSVAERDALVRAIKATRLRVDGTLGFAKAEVTAGGVPLDEVDRDTMASAVVPGLWIAGEVLDYDGRLGGYNLQAAFCTGLAAARSIADA